MISLIFVSVLSFNLIEVGARIGANTPIGNMERYFTAGALGSVYLAKGFGNNRFILSYENCRLEGAGQPTYNLQLDQISVEYCRSVFSRNNWSLPVYLGFSNIWLKRKLLSLEEKGMVQGADIGLGFLESVKRVKFGIGFFVKSLFETKGGFLKIENSAYLLSMRVTVGYEL
ncbi:MAG: hypothetical protein ACETVX_06535 [bacterium]